MRSKLKIITEFIIGAVVFGSLGVYAASKIYSNQVEIDKTGGKLANVNGTKLQDALDYLYSKASMVGECPEGFVCMSTFVHSLKVGDLISMTPTLSTFTTDKSMTGHTSVQTINPQELNLWRVIRKNSDGTVDVVSEYTSSVQIYFSGVIGYTNYIGYLNELASHYENSNYTIGSRYMGYNGQIEYIQNQSKFNEQPPSGAPWNSNTSSSTTSANEALGAGDMGYETDYNLVTLAYIGTTTYGSNASGTAKAYKVGTTTATNYWVASRYYGYIDSFIFNFNGRYVHTSGNLSYSDIRYYFTGWRDSSYSYALRPILTLKADVNAISGDGNSEATAYVLG